MKHWVEGGFGNRLVTEFLVDQCKLNHSIPDDIVIFLYHFQLVLIWKSQWDARYFFSSRYVGVFLKESMIS